MCWHVSINGSVLPEYDRGKYGDATSALMSAVSTIESYAIDLHLGYQNPDATLMLRGKEERVEKAKVEALVAVDAEIQRLHEWQERVANKGE